jgi:hypothetical protein
MRRGWLKRSDESLVEGGGGKDIAAEGNEGEFVADASSFIEEH